MRLVFTLALLVLGTVYAAGAIYFYTQERLARSPARSVPAEAQPCRHPEVLLEAIREAMIDNDFSPPVRALVEQSLAEVPSYYQPPLLLAAYHANRLEEPERTGQAFEAALKRYPANGRMHLAYAQWLWSSRRLPPGAEGGQVPLRVMGGDLLAERHLGTALRLEPELTGEALEVMRREMVPPERWLEIVPHHGQARWELVQRLAEVGKKAEALELLREAMDGSDSAEHFRLAGVWALQWGDPSFALEAARRWQQAEGRPGGSKARYYEAVLFSAKVRLELGETDEAFRVFRAALNQVGVSTPVGLDLLCSMADEYYRRGQLVLAESLFAEAAAGSPTHLPSRLGLARTHLRLGDEGKAIEHYRKVLNMDPQNVEAERELGQLLLRHHLGR